MSEKPPIYAAIDSVVKLVDPPPKNDGKLPYVTHAGIMKIGDANLRCYVLSNGMKIFDAMTLINFLKRNEGRGKNEL